MYFGFGSRINLIGGAYYDAIATGLTGLVLVASNAKCTGASNERIPLRGEANLPLVFYQGGNAVGINFKVADAFKGPLLLGAQTIRYLGTILDYRSMTVTYTRLSEQRQ